MNNELPLLLIGAGGHASTLLDIISQEKIIGYTELKPQKHHGFETLIFLGDDRRVLNYRPSEIEVVNGLGMLQPFSKRREIYEGLKQRHYNFRSVLHSNSVLSRNIFLGEGVQIMAGAILQTGVCIGDNTIINTGSTIDHQSVVGANVHVAPGVTICGGVRIGSNTFLGAGSTVIENITIGENVLIGAGSIVINDLPDNTIAYGNPAKIIRKLGL